MRLIKEMYNWAIIICAMAIIPSLVLMSAIFGILTIIKYIIEPLINQ